MRKLAYQKVDKDIQSGEGDILEDDDDGAEDDDIEGSTLKQSSTPKPYSTTTVSPYLLYSSVCLNVSLFIVCITFMCVKIFQMWQSKYPDLLQDNSRNTSQGFSSNKSITTVVPIAARVHKELTTPEPIIVYVKEPCPDNESIGGCDISSTQSAQPVPTYLYLAAIEGSKHTGFSKVIKGWIPPRHWFQDPPGTGCFWNEDDWLVEVIQEFNSRPATDVFFREASFPFCTLQGREDISRRIDVNDMVGSFERLLPVVMQQRHPTSLLQHFNLHQTALKTAYAFKIIWLQRDFVDAVYSRYKDWNLDKGIRKHAIMLGLFELYLLSEIHEITQLDPTSCIIVHVEDIDDPEKRPHITDMMQELMPNVHGRCENCFGEWASSKKSARAALSKLDVEYIEGIASFIEERKKEYPTNCKSNRD